MHGTYLSNFLITRGYSTRDRLAVLDRFSEPLSVWRKQTESTGMRYLRSPAEHNLDVGTGSLYQYAHAMRAGKSSFERQFRRPDLQLFNRHCDHVMLKRDLHSVRLQGSARAIVGKENGVIEVDTENGALRAKNIILSLGNSENLRIPDWVPVEALSTGRISHVLSMDYQDVELKPEPKDGSRFAVIGGGITAAQKALDLSARFPGRVDLIHGSQLDCRELDFDPCWLKQACSSKLRKLNDYRRRRSVLKSVRHDGSMPAWIMKDLKRAVENGQLSLLNDTVMLATTEADRLELILRDAGSREYGLVALATGFDDLPPGGILLESLQENFALNLAPCGFPIPDRYLQIAENVFVTGSLAELEIGPASRNIYGARLAAEKIITAYFKPRTKPRELSYYYFASRRST